MDIIIDGQKISTDNPITFSDGNHVIEISVPILSEILKNPNTLRPYLCMADETRIKVL